MSFYDEMLKIADEWAAKSGASAIDVEAAADYALKHKRYDRPAPTQREMCIRDMRLALQQAKFVDAQGNEVRARLALRIIGEQLELPGIVYIDPRTAKPDRMLEVFRQNWEGIQNHVKRHAIEKQSYDLNNVYNATLPMFNYDFTQAAEEAKMTGKYDDNGGLEGVPTPELAKV